MKKLLIFVALMTFAAHASAGYYCRADSVDGYGWGQNVILEYARDRALMECASVTMVWNTCYITECVATRGETTDGANELDAREASEIKENAEPGHSKSGYLGEDE